MLCAEQTCPSEIATLAMRRATEQTLMIFGQMNEPPGARLRVALSALSMAECFRAVQRWSGPLFAVILDVMAVGDTLAPPGS